MTMYRTIPPEVMAVPLADAKGALRIEDDVTDLDTQVTTWTKGVIALAENKTGQCLMRQTWEVRLDAFPDCEIELPHPVLEIVSVKYLDLAGVEQTLAPEAYRMKREAYRTSIRPIVNTVWPSTLDETDAVVVVVECGYGDDPADVPENFTLYVLAKLVEQFDPAVRPDSGTVQSDFVERLLDGYVCKF
jgi:uncharacterized phiE125 gp8 family phage protein